MKPTFSPTAESFLKSKSAVREIMDYANPATFKKLGLDPAKVISFGGGWVGHSSPERLREIYLDIVSDEKLFYKSGGYAPTLGLQECRDAIANYESRIHGCKTMSADNIAIGASSTQMTCTLLQAILSKGCNLLTIAPSYCNYPSQVSIAADARIDRFNIFDTTEWAYSYAENTEKFCSYIKETKPTAVLLTSPENPGSQVLPDSFVKPVFETVEETGSTLIIDFAYKDMVFDERYPRYFSWEPNDNFVSIHSNSKWGRNLGRRLGWVEGTSEMIAHLESLLSSEILCGDTMHQMALGAYLSDASENGKLAHYISKTNDKYQAAASATLHAIDTHLGFKRLEPQGGLFTVMDVSPLDGGAFTMKMLKEAGVLFIPGWGFGRSTRDAVRVSYGPHVYDTDKIDEGFERVGEVISNGAP